MLIYLVSVALLAGEPSSSNLGAGPVWDDGSVMFVSGKCETYLQTGNVHWGISADECNEVAVLDRALNDAYRKRMSTLARDAKNTLKTSQRQWIAFRNSTCGLDEPVSIIDESTSSCFIDETKKRISFLENHGIR